MIRQENKIVIRTSVRTVKKRFRIFCVALSLLVLLTGCEGTDKALVFSAEDFLAEDAEEIEAIESGLESGLYPEAEAEGAAAQLICVHVCGAVLNPGVVEVLAGSRAQDALEAAGGFAQEADRDYVNLASPVEDGQQLYFPTIEEAERWREGMTVSRSGQILTESVTGLININTADEKLLCTLPGIGQTRAQAIIAYREQKGLFEKPEDIMKVTGIKQSAFDKISAQITVE